MAGRPKKHLADYVAARSFQVKRHRRLLDGELATDPVLREIQIGYQRSASERERVRLAQEFEATVRGLPEQTALERIRGMQLGEFTRTFLTDFKGHRHGRPLELERFQVDFDADVERRGEDGERLFSIANLIIPRGCGKTTFAAAKCLFEILRRPQKTEGYFIAESKEQAGRAFDSVSTWARMNPDGEGDRIDVARCVCARRGFLRDEPRLRRRRRKLGVAS